jgi:hypothetical protein
MLRVSSAYMFSRQMEAYKDVKIQQDESYYSLFILAHIYCRLIATVFSKII